MPLRRRRLPAPSTRLRPLAGVAQTARPHLSMRFAVSFAAGGTNEFVPFAGSALD